MARDMARDMTGRRENLGDECSGRRREPSAVLMFCRIGGRTQQARQGRGTGEGGKGEERERSGRTDVEQDTLHVHIQAGAHGRGSRDFEATARKEVKMAVRCSDVSGGMSRSGGDVVVVVLVVAVVVQWQVECFAASTSQESLCISPTGQSGSGEGNRLYASGINRARQARMRCGKCG
jgi:hypothetical protein